MPPKTNPETISRLQAQLRRFPDTPLAQDALACGEQFGWGHPATIGAVLGLARFLHDRPWMRVTALGGDWGALNEEIDPYAEDLECWATWYQDPKRSYCLIAAKGQTELECLVVALEAVEG